MLSKIFEMLAMPFPSNGLILLAKSSSIKFASSIPLFNLFIFILLGTA